MYKVSILVTQVGKVHSAIIDSFEERLREYPQLRKAEIEIVETYSTAPHFIEGKIKSILLVETDLILAIGSCCALAAAEETSRKRHKTPVLFSSVAPDLVDSICGAGAHVTGSYSRPVSNIIPLQILIRLRPERGRYLVVHREYEQISRLNHEAWKMGKCLRANLKEFSIVSVPLDVDVGELLKDEIEEGVVLISPLGGLSLGDMELLKKVCEERGAEFAASGDNIVPKNSLIGLKASFEVMGTKLAEYTKRILVDKVTPGDLPVSELRDGLGFYHNGKLVGGEGVIPPTDGVLCSLDDVKDYLNKPQYYYCALDPWTFLFGVRCVRGIQDLAHKHEDGYYGCSHVELFSPLREDWEQVLLQALDPEYDYQAVTTFDYDVLHDIQKKMLETSTFKPILSIAIADDDAPTMADEPALQSGINWPHDKAPIARIRVEPLDMFKPLRRIDELRAMCIDKDGNHFGTAKRIGFLYAADPENMPRKLGEYISKLETLLQKQGRQLVHGGAANLHEMIKISHDIIRHTDASFMLERFMRPDAVIDIARYAVKKNHLMCGPGLEDGTLFPIFCGSKTEILGKPYFRCIKGLLSKLGLLPDHELFISAADRAAFGINPKLCEKIGMYLPQGVHDMLDQGLSVEEAIHQFVEQKELLRPYEPEKNSLFS